jgi:hypothetical protein
MLRRLLTWLAAARWRSHAARRRRALQAVRRRLFPPIGDNLPPTALACLKELAQVDQFEAKLFAVVRDTRTWPPTASTAAHGLRRWIASHAMGMQAGARVLTKALAQARDEAQE